MNRWKSSWVVFKGRKVDTKKGIAALLATVLCLGCFTSCALREGPGEETQNTTYPNETQATVPTQASGETEEKNIFIFEEMGDGTCAVAGFIGAIDAELCIPSNAPDGSVVVAVAENAFRNRDEIRSVTLPDGVKAIGEYTFAGCDSLNELHLPNSLKSIADFAFVQCAGLTHITIPAGVERIGAGAFGRCESLTSIRVDTDNPIFHSAGNCVIRAEDNTLVFGCSESTIPADGTVTTIGEYAFYGAAFAEFVVPDCVNRIERSAFSYCTNLTDITLPCELNYLGESAFNYCTALQTIEIPYGISNLEPSLFSQCVSLVDVKIPYSVSSIGIYAFDFCSAMTHIALPGSVSEILEAAFSGCNSLRDISYGGTVHQWQSVFKRYEWAASSAYLHISCTDGALDEIFDLDNYKKGDNTHGTDNEN